MAITMVDAILDCSAFSICGLCGLSFLNSRAALDLGNDLVKLPPNFAHSFNLMRSSPANDRLSLLLEPCDQGYCLTLGRAFDSTGDRHSRDSLKNMCYLLLTEIQKCLLCEVVQTISLILILPQNLTVPPASILFHLSG